MGTETTKYRIVLDDRLTPELRRALTQANAFDNKMKVMQGRAKSTGNTLARAFGGVAILTGITAVTRSIIKLGAEMEQTRIRFETFTGSAVIGNQLVDQLNEFSKVTTFTNREVLKAGNALLGYGLSAEELLPTMKILGDISAGTGKNLSELGIIFGQIRGENKLNAQDWRQLVTAGFNPLQQISERTGKSIATLRKEMSLGLISFAQVKQAFIDATSEGGRFYNMNEKLSQTLAGRWSTLVGTLQLLGAEISTNFTGGLADAIKAINEFVMEATPTIMNMINTISIGFDHLGDSLTDLGEKFSPGGDFWSDVANGIAFAGSAIISAIGLIVDTISNSLTVAGGALTTVAGLVLDPLSALANTLFGTEKTNYVSEGNKKISEGLSTQFKDFDEWATNMGQSLLQTGFLNIPGWNFGGASGSNNKTKKTVTDAGGNPLGLGELPLGTSNAKGGGSVSGMQSKVRNITVNIQKMVENINFNNMTSQQSEAAMVEGVKKALLTAINDVNVIAR